MRTGMLCRSDASTAVCRSHASTAVCVPMDAKGAIAPRRHVGGYDVKYSRLGGDGRRVGSGGDRIRPVTLAMVTKRERAPAKPKARPRTRPTNATAAVTSNSVPALAAASTDDQLFQEVVMKVSIHCQGCAGKVRKHISKMEGVTSFSIDLESKRVTVVGNVSPVGVLESISKVKKAEFWTC